MKHTRHVVFGVLLVTIALFARNHQITQFANPLGQGEDPWVILHDGYYYVVSSGPLDPTAVYISRSATLVERGEKVVVWEGAGNYNRVFAPELHRINGVWYIYLCADAKTHQWKHQAMVLQAYTDDPLDGFENKGVLFTGDAGGLRMANDITVVQMDGYLQAFWGALDDPGALGMVTARMNTPVEITGYRTAIDLHAEGPRAFSHNGVLFMTGSSGDFQSKDYCMVVKRYDPGQGQIGEARAWVEMDTLLQSSADVWGPARTSFTTSPDGTEHWMMFHSKMFEADRNGMRHFNIQKYDFDSSGRFICGPPAGPSVFQDLPSGDPGLGMVYEAEDFVADGGAQIAHDRLNFQGEGFVANLQQEGAAATFNVDVPDSGWYRVVARYSNGLFIQAEQQANPIIYPSGKSTLSVHVNGVRQIRTSLERTADWNTWSYQGENLNLKAGQNTIVYRYDASDIGAAALDYITLRPADQELRGLVGSYFNGMDFQDSLLSRIDRHLWFNWGNGAPDNALKADSFSVRWNGYVMPRFSQTYTFYITSDNGRRLWIDNRSIIDEWKNDYDITYSGTITLDAGQRYPIKAEYFDGFGGANFRLEWESASQQREVIPQSCFFLTANPPTGTGAPEVRSSMPLSGREVRCSFLSGNLLVSLSAGAGSEATVRLVDCRGKTVFVDRQPLTDGQGVVRFATRPAAGSYLVQVCTLHGWNGVGSVVVH